MPKSGLTARITSAKSDEWGTPRHLVAALRAEFTLGVDLAARRDNRVAPAYLGPDHPEPSLRDALAVDWSRLLRAMGPHVVGFLNPPFSQIDAFLAKCWEERQRGAVLVTVLPHKTETVWYHELAVHADEIRQLRRRLVYLVDGQPVDSALFASSVVIWNGRAPVFRTGPRVVWWDLGTPRRQRRASGEGQQA